MARLCGVDDKRQVIGRRAGAFFPQSLAKRYEILDRQVLASGRPIMNMIDLSLRAGRVPTWLIFSRTPVLDRQGSVVGVAAAANIVGLGDRNRLAVERLARAVAALKSDFRGPLDIKRLARRARASPAQLQRDFANFLFLSPRAFQRKLRMERAVELIEDGYHISEVALECGYTDHSAFTRSFKKVMGMPPKQYRNLFGARKRN